MIRGVNRLRSFSGRLYTGRRIWGAKNYDYLRCILPPAVELVTAAPRLGARLAGRERPRDFASAGRDARRGVPELNRASEGDAQVLRVGRPRARHRSGPPRSKAIWCGCWSRALLPEAQPIR